MYPAQCLGAITIHGRRVPRAPLPGSGVTRAWVSSHDTSEGVAPPSSLLRAHAPVHPPPGIFSLGLYARSLQVAASPYWQMDLPDIITTILPEVTGPLPRDVPSLLVPVSSRRTSASRYGRDVRHTGFFLHCSFSRGSFSGLQSFLHVQSPLFAWPPDCSHRISYEMGGRAVYTTH